MNTRTLSIAMAVLAALDGCEQDQAQYDVKSLQDPSTCEGCHPQHYREWLGSMHAYAGDDPVFIAMNQRGQRETNGELGDFCVRCHAPVAVALGTTFDGTNLSELPSWQRGVTCYFCHNVETIEGTHNNPLTLALDGIMRGNLSDPMPTDAHGAAYSPWTDGNTLASGELCGSCHDIVTPGGVEIERTYAEWLQSFYSDPDPDHPDSVALYGQTCNYCHMPGSTGAISDVPGVPGDRRRHSHLWPGVDVAITDFPNPQLAPELRLEQLQAILEFRKAVLCGNLCVREQDGQQILQVWMHNEAAGHGWPSGANQDRRAWIEIVAYDDADGIIYSSGVIADDEVIEEQDDPELWLFRDRIFDAEGQDVHMFWEAEGYESLQLEVPDEVGGDATTWVMREFVVPSGIPSRVTLRMRLQPIARAVLDDLVASGDLDPAHATAASAISDVAPSVMQWTPEDAIDSIESGTCVGTALSCWSPGL